MGKSYNSLSELLGTLATDPREEYILVLPHNEGIFRIVTRYEAPSGGIYAEFAFWILLLMGSTQISTYAQRRSSDIPLLRSWVSDWSSSDETRGHVSSHALRLPK